jgi:uncharacterized membrane protein
VKYITSSPFIVFCLIILSAILRVLNINSTDLGGDECFSLFMSQYNLGKINEVLKTGDNPPFWEFFLHFWCEFFGRTELAIRIPSFIFNVLTIVPIYLIGKTISNKRVGFFASLFFIFSSFSLFISHEARVYSFVGLIATLSFFYFLKFLETENKLRNLVLLTLCNTLLFYSHYISILVIVTQFLSFFIFNDKLKVNLKWYVLHILFWLIFISPFFPVLINRFFDSGVKGTWVSNVTGINDLYFLLLTFLNKPLIVVLFLAVICFSIVRFFLFKKKIQSKQIIMLHFWIWFSIIFSFLLSFKISFFLNRYLYFLLPILFLSFSCLLNSIIFKINLLNLFLPVLVTLLMALTFRLDSTKMEYSGHHFQTSIIVNEMVEYLKDKNTIVLVCPYWYEKEIMYYLDKKTFFSNKKINKLDTVFYNDLKNKRIYMVGRYNEIVIPTKINKVVYFDNDCNFHYQNNMIEEYLKSELLLQKKYQIERKNISVYKLK